MHPAVRASNLCATLDLFLIPHTKAAKSFRFCFLQYFLSQSSSHTQCFHPDAATIISPPSDLFVSDLALFSPFFTQLSV